MFKKLFVTTVLCIGLITFGVGEAKAGRGMSFSGGLGLVPGSVYCQSLWKGIGNLDKNYAEVQCNLTLQEADVICQNNGGNTGGVGQPFTIDETITGIDLLDNNQLVGHGKAFSEVYFSDETLYNAVLPYLSDDDTCDQNDNWSAKVIVLKAFAEVEGYSDYDGDGELTLDDEAAGECELSTDGTEYNCTLCDSDGAGLYICPDGTTYPNVN